jgi:hypothetical protein
MKYMTPLEQWYHGLVSPILDLGIWPILGICFGLAIIITIFAWLFLRKEHLKINWFITVLYIDSALNIVVVILCILDTVCLNNATSRILGMMR